MISGEACPMKKGCIMFILLLCMAVFFAFGAEAATDSGTFGNGFSWSLDEEGLLTITGSGKMPKFQSAADAPWKDYRSDILDIELDNRITSISFRAFDSCSGLTNVTLPEGITMIEQSAFTDCVNLTSITLPESLTTISDAAFYRCSSLTSISLPEGLTAISNITFFKCTNLKNVNIPKNVTSIGTSAFNGCTSLSNVVLPEGVISIGNSAFAECNNLKSITFPETLTNIGKNAFQNCWNLKNVVFQKNLTSIGASAFSSCRSLTSIIIPKNVTSIGNSAFRNCNLLTNITVMNENETFSSVDGVLFNHDKTELLAFPQGREGSYFVPSGVTSIDAYAFSGCRLKSIILPEGLTSIGASAFYNTINLYSVTLPASVTSLGDNSFDMSLSLKKICFAGDRMTFGRSVFYPKPTIYCYSLTDIDEYFTNNGYTVKYLDMENMDNLRTVTLPSGNFRLGYGKSQNIDIDIFPNHDHPTVTWTSSDPAVATVENGVVTAVSVGQATITATVGQASASVLVTTYIAADSFSLAPAEEWIVAKNSLQLSIVNLIPENAETVLTWTSSDDSLATVDQNGLVTSKFPGDVVITATSAEGVRAEALLHLCYPVTAISFAEPQITAILGQEYALTANVTMRTQSCVNHLVAFASSDESIATVNENGVVTPLRTGTATITATAANGISASCTVEVRNIVYVTLPANLKSIEAEVFVGSAFEGVIIPEGCESIGSRAFADCPNLVYIKIPATVTDIAADAFDGCGEVTIDRY